MSWYKKVFSREERNSTEYQNMIEEIRSRFHQHPNKLDEFAVFKEDVDEDNHILYFSPTDDPAFTSIIHNALNAEKCAKPNLNNAKLYLGRFL